MKRRLRVYKKTVSIVNETAIGMYESLVGNKKGFLLESYDKNYDRYTFFGKEPEEIITSRGDALVIRRNNGTEEIRQGNPLERLKEYYSEFDIVKENEELSFSGGLVGNLGYDFVRYAEVLPEDKAAFVEKEKAAGRKVIMIGDGINDSPALSAADVGIAISNGAEIAREIADITVGADDLGQIVTLRRLSNRLMKRIQSNYRFIVGFNSGLIVLGVTGVIQPTTSALLHNTSTLAIGLKSMKNLL